MSGATYRIDVEHHPDSTSTYVWVARIFRLSDDQVPAVMWGESADEAITKARTWVAERHDRQPTRTLYVNDEGADELPHSVQA